LLFLLADGQANSDRVAELITFDPALTAKVLQVCNSALFRGAEPVHDLPGAITRLGFSEIYQIVAAVAGEQTLGGMQRGYGIGQGELWRHSAVTAVAGKVMAREAGTDENLLFTAALLHDLGKLALSTALESNYAEVARQTEEANRSFLEAEQDILGTDHAEVGGRLLEKWKFPEYLVQAVRHHHDPMQAKPHEVLTAGVHLADMLAHLLGHGYGHHAYAVRARTESLALLEFTAKDVEQLVIKTQAALESSRLLKAN